MPKTLDDIADLAEKRGIPFEDVLFIDLNRKGVVIDTTFERIRFYFKPSNNGYFNESKQRGIEEFFFALPTHTGFSDYHLVDRRISLVDEEIGTVREIENDTCDSTYPRREGTVINLNPNSKSTCHGCAFCHTFKQDARDISELSIGDFITKHVEAWLKKYDKPNLSHLYRVDIITGCFGSEEETVRNLHLVRNIFSTYGYNDEIFYFGSEITSEQALDKLKEIEPFALCLSLECFENRSKLLREHKARISSESAKQILGMSKERGFGTHFSYVLGIEPVKVVLKGMEEFSPYINRLPVVNIFQPHTRGQKRLLVPEANEIEYFLNVREGLEKIFNGTDYKPRTWGNYRCLWYLKFQGKDLDGARLP